MVYADNESEAYKPGYGTQYNYGAPPYYGALPYTGVSPSYAGSPSYDTGTGLYGPSFGPPYGMNQPSPYTNPYADGGYTPYGFAGDGFGQPFGMSGYGADPYSGVASNVSPAYGQSGYSKVSPVYGQPGYGNVSPAFGQQGYGMGGWPGGYYPGYGFGGGYGWGGGFGWLWLLLALLIAGAVLFYYFFSRGFFSW